MLADNLRPLSNDAQIDLASMLLNTMSTETLIGVTASALVQLEAEGHLAALASIMVEDYRPTASSLVSEIGRAGTELRQ